MCHFTDSEIGACIPYSSDYAAIYTNYDKIKVVRITVKAIGGRSQVAGLDCDVDGTSAFWSELENSIYVAGTMSISPEASSKQLLVQNNCRLTIENGAAFDTKLFDGAVFTAASVKSLFSNGTAKILLTDEIPSITVSGVIANSGWFTLEYKGGRAHIPSDFGS